MYDEITLRLRREVNYERRAQAMGFADGGLAACLFKNVERVMRAWLRGLERLTLLPADSTQAWKLAVTAKEFIYRRLLEVLSGHA